jgi:guanylate kinase
MDNRKAILFSAPSGSGKTTIIKRLSKSFDCFEFSISATSRKPRDGERDGVDYYFIAYDDFKEQVAKGDFLEWEEVYQGLCYGTLKSEVERIWNNGHVIVFDVDVMGGQNLKRYFGDAALSIFVKPPSMEVLEQRLRNRGTETEESIKKRLGRAELELKQGVSFDVTVVNDDLQTAIQETTKIVEEFLTR